MGYLYECCPGSIAAPMTDVYAAAAEISFLPSLKAWGCSGREMKYLEKEAKQKLYKRGFLLDMLGVKIYLS